MKITQRTMERSIINVIRRDKIPNAPVKRRTEAIGIAYIVKKSKIKYAGQMTKASTERWNKRIY